MISTLFTILYIKTADHLALKLPRHGPSMLKVDLWNLWCISDRYLQSVYSTTFYPCWYVMYATFPWWWTKHVFWDSCEIDLSNTLIIFVLVTFIELEIITVNQGIIYLQVVNSGKLDPLFGLLMNCSNILTTDRMIDFVIQFKRITCAAPD